MKGSTVLTQSAEVLSDGQAVPLVRDGLQHVLQGLVRFGGIIALTQESCHDARGCHDTISPYMTQAEHNNTSALHFRQRRRIASGTPRARLVMSRRRTSLKGGTSNIASHLRAVLYGTVIYNNYMIIDHCKYVLNIY